LGGSQYVEKEIDLYSSVISCINPNRYFMYPIKHRSLDENQRVAEEFVKKEATYRFDGIPVRQQGK
jgi:hypothetical protein